MIDMPDPMSAADPRPKIIAFGDSTTAPREGVTIYADLLRSELPKLGFDALVLNAGVPSSTTTQGDSQEAAPLVDIYQAFQRHAKRSQMPHDELLLDGIHPNSAGHRLIADLLLPPIRTELAAIRAVGIE